MSPNWKKILKAWCISFLLNKHCHCRPCRHLRHAPRHLSNLKEKSRLHSDAPQAKSREVPDEQHLTRDICKYFSSLAQTAAGMLHSYWESRVVQPGRLDSVSVCNLCMMLPSSPVTHWKTSLKFHKPKGSFCFLHDAPEEVTGPVQPQAMTKLTI